MSAITDSSLAATQMFVNDAAILRPDTVGVVPEHAGSVLESYLLGEKMVKRTQKKISYLIMVVSEGDLYWVFIVRNEYFCSIIER